MHYCKGQPQTFLTLPRRKLYPLSFNEASRSRAAGELDPKRLNKPTENQERTSALLVFCWLI